VPRVGYRLELTGSNESAPDGGVNRRRLLVGSAATAAVAGLGGWWWAQGGIGRADGIAVLPFENLSKDAAQDYLSAGISEEIRNTLSRLPGLKVVGRTSSEALGHTDAQTAARRLHVSHVLTGSVRRSRSFVRVAVELIDGRTGFETWSQSYDLAPGDPLQLQTQIGEAVALALRVELRPGDRAALAAGGTRSPIANDLYLQAKLEFRLRDTEASFRKVIALSEAAIGVDARFAEAFALKGMAWDAIGGSFTTDPGAMQGAYAKAAEAGRAAISIAPQLADGYVALARSYSGRLNVRGALEQYRRAAALPRTDPGILSWWVQTLAEVGKTAEALVLSQTLLALDPLNAAIFGRKAFAHFFARQFDLAIRASRQALSLAPGLTEQLSLIGDCLSLLGKYPEALAHYATAPALDPYRISGEAVVAARTGDHARARRLIDQIGRVYGDTMSYQVAQIFAQMRAVDEALAALERGRRVLDPGLNGLPADPFVDPLRGERRFAALVQSLHFPA
jgi:TolB-like protein